jgi:hypothetical protein
MKLFCLLGLLFRILETIFIQKIGEITKVLDTTLTETC